MLAAAVKATRSAVVVALLFAGHSTAALADDKNTPPRPASGALSHAIPAAELPMLERQAMQGDGEAALRLSKHYIFIAFDKKKHDYWIQVAAENGSALGMYNYAQSLRQGNDLDAVRARYWFEKVVQLGPSPLAEEAKKRLSDAW